MCDAKTLTVSMFWRRRRLYTSSVSSSPSLTSSTFSARSRSAFAFFVRALGASSAVASPASAMSSAMIAPSTSRTSVRLSRFLVRSRSRTAKKSRRMSELRPVAERAQERGGRELLLLVDVDVDDVVDVDRELDPRAAERDDARRDEALSVRVRRLLEHDARRPVQLADDDALGAVDDEGAERREQRQLTEIDLLLDDVARPLLLVHLLVDDELQRRLERRRVGHVALDALLDGVLGLAERVANELEREVLVDVGDREQVLEDPLETDVLAVVRSGIQLEQRLEGARLDVEEVGHLHPLRRASRRKSASSIQALFTRAQAKNGRSPRGSRRNRGRRGER